jgi:hypothetical protein
MGMPYEGAGVKRACWACGAPVDTQDSYCRRCGKGQGDHLPWYYKPWGIIAMTVFGLGPFGIFLVWRSPRLSPGAKAAYTAGILLATAYAVHRLRQLLMFYQAALTGMQPY